MDICKITNIYHDYIWQIEECCDSESWTQYTERLISLTTDRPADKWLQFTSCFEV